MYKNYFYDGDKTIVSDENSFYSKETHDNIIDELNLENEIEQLTISINMLEKEKNKLGTIEENRKYRKKSNLIAISLLLFVIIFSKRLSLALGDNELLNQILPFILMKSDEALMTIIPATLIFTAPFTIFTPLKIRTKEKRRIMVEEKLEFLHSELTQKKEDLETLRKNAKKENIKDLNIRTLDLNTYRQNLSSKLALLECIKKYRKRLQKHLEAGTLKEELTKMGVTPENIAFAEEVLIRTLKKQEN